MLAEFSGSTGEMGAPELNSIHQLRATEGPRYNGGDPAATGCQQEDNSLIRGIHKPCEVLHPNLSSLHVHNFLHDKGKDWMGAKLLAEK